MDILKNVDISRIDLSAATTLITSPWVMEAGAFNALIGTTAAQLLAGEFSLSADTSPRVRENGYATRLESSDAHGVAVMQIRGMISPYGGDTNPHAIRHDANKLREDPSIRTVIMDIDSPGGTSAGLPGAVEALERLGAEKRLISWNNDLAASAGYWLAATANEAYSAPDADSGSVGVYIAIPDYSAMMAKMGIEMNVLRDGALKGMGLFGKALTEAEKSHLQQRVDELSVDFKGYIRERRPGVEDDTMQGQTFPAPAALKKGLIDGIFDDLPALVASVISAG